MKKAIVRAIRDRRLLEFSYHGLQRLVEPHVLGVRHGVTQLLGYQVGGGSRSGRLPEWRRFELREMYHVTVTRHRFAGPREASWYRAPSWDRRIASVETRPSPRGRRAAAPEGGALADLPVHPELQRLGEYDGVVQGATRIDHDSDWELHPDGDTCLLLLSGRLDVVLDTPKGERTLALHPRAGCVVPRGTWHRQVVHEPGALLLIAPQAGTEHRARTA